MSHAGASQRDGLELILDWLDALRQGDLDAVQRLLTPDVVWHGVSPDLVCVGRDEVLEVLREQLPVRCDADALELLRAPNHVVMGTRSDHLPQPDGIDLRGQVYNVFEQRDGAFATIRDFTTRADALDAAGLAGRSEWI
jgi:ketosteroid isomerase-like protein